MKIMSTLALLCLSVSCLATPVVIPKTDQYVTDASGTLSAQQLTDLKSKADLIDKQTGTVVVTLMVPTSGEEDIDTFAQRAAETLHPGHAGDDRGVVLVIVKNDKKWAIRTTRNTGQTFTDVQSKVVLKHMGERYKSSGKDFYPAINLFLDETLPFVQKVADVSTNPVVPVQHKEDYTWVLYLGGLLLLMTGGGIWYTMWENKKRIERDNRIAKLAAERREQERERDAIRRQRNLDAQLRTKTELSKPIAYGAGVTAAAYSPSAYTRTYTPTPPAPKREVKKEEPKKSSSYYESTSTYSSRSNDDDSYSRSNSSSYSSPSSSSSYDSSSSSSSYDGGGSSSSFD